MHTRSVEKDTFTPPISKEIMDRATVSTTKAMVSESRLELEKKARSSMVNSQPRKQPSPREATISMSGSTMMPTKSVLPVTRELAMPKEMANTARPTASSKATTGSRMSVSLPFALYWRTTMSVAAGAVAVAMAPRTIVASRDSLSGIRKCKPISARSTKSVAARA